MKKIVAHLVLMFLFINAQAGIDLRVEDASSVEGRWDLTVDLAGKATPSWLEVQHSGHKTLIGRFVYAFGSARPIAKINVSEGKYSFAIPPQWEEGTSDMQFEFTSDGTKLTG